MRVRVTPKWEILVGHNWHLNSQPTKIPLLETQNSFSNSPQVLTIATIVITRLYLPCHHTPLCPKHLNEHGRPPRKVEKSSLFQATSAIGDLPQRQCVRWDDNLDAQSQCSQESFHSYRSTDLGLSRREISLQILVKAGDVEAKRACRRQNDGSPANEGEPWRYTKCQRCWIGSIYW